MKDVARIGVAQGNFYFWNCAEGIIKTFCICNALIRERYNIADHLDTISQLTAFKDAVAQYGLTRSLLAFANHDQTLSNAIPTIPAVLTADRSVKNSQDVIAAVEAVNAAPEYIVGRRLIAARARVAPERLADPSIPTRALG